MASVLAVDVGSSSVRAQVFGERGEPVDELRQAAYGGDDPDEIVALVREVVGGRDRSVDAVGVSCFGQSLLALDGAGRPLTPVLGWRDNRSAGAAAELKRRTDPAAVHARTGQHLHPSFWPAKLLWLAGEQPDVFAAPRASSRSATTSTPSCSGVEPAMSVSIASSTGLLDLAGSCWDAELLELVGVDESRLPRIGDEPHGAWYPALFDGACSNLGAGCTGPGRAALMVGTSAALRVLYETDEPRPRPGLFLYRADDRRFVEGGALSDGGNLDDWLGPDARGSGGLSRGTRPGRPRPDVPPVSRR